MIVLFLSGMVAMIMMRTLRADINKYNQLESGEDAQEETGWKLVSAGQGMGAEVERNKSVKAVASRKEAMVHTFHLHLTHNIDVSRCRYD